jgi:hypothetical protein
MFKEEKGRWGYIWGACFIYYHYGCVLLLDGIWGYVYLQRYYSFVIFVYLNYVCIIAQVYLVIGLSFQYVVFLVFGRLFYMCVLCQIYVKRILSFDCLLLWPGYVLYMGF